MWPPGRRRSRRARTLSNAFVRASWVFLSLHFDDGGACPNPSVLAGGARWRGPAEDAFEQGGRTIAAGPDSICQTQSAIPTIPIPAPSQSRYAPPAGDPTARTLVTRSTVSSPIQGRGPIGFAHVRWAACCAVGKGAVAEGAARAGEASHATRGAVSGRLVAEPPGCIERSCASLRATSADVRADREDSDRGRAANPVKPESECRTLPAARLAGSVQGDGTFAHRALGVFRQVGPLH